tara:strand:+ start:760 stop:1122 length:363 start_codon:yes stop_codon:yes gene_type:complete
MLFNNLYNFIIILIVIFLLSLKSSFADNKLVMITADYCIYCQIWEEEIGEIYPKTDIAISFPLERIELDENSVSNNSDNYETNITPTFVFFKENEEIGRIVGYSSAEMFWWQVDEILDLD